MRPSCLPPATRWLSAGFLGAALVLSLGCSEPEPPAETPATEPPAVAETPEPPKKRVVARIPPTLTGEPGPEDEIPWQKSEAPPEESQAGLAGCDGQKLFEAVQRGRLATVKGCLAGGANPNGPAGKSALLEAARRGFTEIGLELIRGGADVNRMTSSGGFPLLIAAQVGDEALVRALIDAGVDVRGRGAMVLASLRGKPARKNIYNLLVSAGAPTR